MSQKQQIKKTKKTKKSGNHQRKKGGLLYDGWRSDLDEVGKFCKEKWRLIIVIAVVTVLLAIFWTSWLADVSDAIGFVTQIVTFIIAILAWLRFKKWERTNRLGHAKTQFKGNDMVLIVSIAPENNPTADNDVRTYLESRTLKKGDGEAFCSRFKQITNEDERKLLEVGGKRATFELKCLTATDDFYRSNGICGLSISSKAMPLDDIPEKGENVVLGNFFSNLERALTIVEEMSSMVSDIHVFCKVPVPCSMLIAQRFKNSRTLYIYHYDNHQYLPTICLRKSGNLVLGTRLLPEKQDNTTK